jgi:hypothetical protein
MGASRPGGGLVILRDNVIVEESENDGKNNSTNNQQDVTNVVRFWVQLVTSCVAWSSSGTCPFAYDSFNTVLS